MFRRIFQRLLSILLEIFEIISFIIVLLALVTSLLVISVREWFGVAAKRPMNTFYPEEIDRA